jgi:hypothetical protein
MVGYYIISGILVIFFLGISSIFLDNMFTIQDEEIYIEQPKQPVENLAQFIVDDYEYDYDDDDKALGF